MSGSGNLLNSVITHSRKIYNNVSQNMCCRIVLFGLSHRKEFCEQKSMGIFQ
jgi:predicted phosphodiesterase